MTFTNHYSFSSSSQVEKGEKEETKEEEENDNDDDLAVFVTYLPLVHIRLERKHKEVHTTS